MALRQPLQQCLRAQFTLPTISLCRSFTTTAPALSRAPNLGVKKRRRDPYAKEQARAQKAANLSRQEVLKKERAEQLGDPIRGNETQFTRSFDNPPSIEPTSSDGRQNFFVRDTELEDGIARSKWLMSPLPIDNNGTETPELLKQRQEENAQHDNAAEALRRINALSIGSSKDRLRVNVQRCISTFGRHNTDQVLPRRASSIARTEDAAGTEDVALRAGPDTGSSEVQIAILTAKIRTLTQFVEGRGRQDKHNRRNLTLLVHRRQKLLKYLQRKERGGPRWQNLIQTLGLTDGTWKGEITLPRYI